MSKIDYPKSFQEFSEYLNSLNIVFEENGESFSYRNMTEQMFLLYVYYHYFNADQSSIADILTGDTYEEGSIDMISGIYIDKNSENEDDIDVIVCYCPDKKTDLSSFPQILKNEVIKGLFRTYNRRDKISEAIKEQEIKLDKKHIKIVFITNFMLDKPTKLKLRKEISGIKIANEAGISDETAENTEFLFYDGNDILSEILSVEKPSEYVDEATIRIDFNNNVLKYKDSILVNISAKSLQDLFNQYGSMHKGLLAQNLRFFVASKNIDANITASIQERGEDFWYLNNGIIIICDDYKIKDDKISLHNFSIINGGQTTYIIGNTDFEDDFYLQCKIIKNTQSDENEKIYFISSVAEASNSQKAIKSKDLIANRPEQRALKNQLKNAGIFCLIKRGDKVSKKIYPKKWQITKNEELGQFIFSFMYLMPGPARNNPATIFSKSGRYNLIFKQKYNSDLIKDLLIIKCAYNCWRNKIGKDETLKTKDPWKVKLVNNGLLFTISLIGIIAKLYYHEDYFDKILQETLPENRIKILSKLDLGHPIFNETVYEDKGEEKLFKLFDMVYTQFYRKGFEFLTSYKAKNDFSNFTKLNKNFEQCVCKYVFDSIETDTIKKYLASIKPLLHQQTKEELIENQKLLDLNWCADTVDKSSGVSEGNAKSIHERLLEFRTKTRKAKKIPAYYIFNDEQGEKIAEAAPQTLEELEALNILPPIKLKYYGKYFVNIVKEVLEDPSNTSEN